MGLLDIIQKKKNVETSTTDDASSHSGSQISRVKKARGNQRTSINTGSSSGEVNKALVAEAFMATWNRDEIAADSCCKKFFVSEKAKCKMEDGVSMSAGSLLTALNLLHRSFPDVKFTWEYMTEKPQLVVVDGLRCTGTHTGDPFTFLPGALPAIPTTGIHCDNDEECLYLNFEGGKIKSISFIAMGNSTCFSGFYEMIGGSLDPLTSEAPEASE